MTNNEALDRLICLKLSYKIRIEEEDIEALEKGIEALKNKKTVHWTIKQYQVPIKNKQIPTVISYIEHEPTACKIAYTYTHSVCKSEEYLNKYNYCPNCGAKMVGENNDE